MTFCFGVGVQGAIEFAHNYVDAFLFPSGGEDASPFVSYNGRSVFYRRGREAQAFCVIVCVLCSFCGVFALGGRWDSGFHLVNAAQAGFNRVRIL